MSRYSDYLPMVFPRMVSGRRPAIKKLVALLMRPRSDVPHGSSFAVVSGIATGGMLSLYLSEVSYRYLVGLNEVTHSELHRTT